MILGRSISTASRRTQHFFRPASARPRSARSIVSISPAATAFEALPSATSSKSEPKQKSEVQPPSLLWKAYAAALKPYLTTNDHLASRSSAIFICSPFSFGIPAGSGVPAEIMNQQIANTCDHILVADSPILDEASEKGSYFETLFQYLSSVDASASSDANTARITAARAVLKTCQDAALQAYNRDQARFLQFREMDPTVNFTEWMKDFGIEYTAAFVELQLQLAAFKRLLGTSASPVGPALELMLSARSKLNFQAGNNMPCSAQDVSASIQHDGAENPMTLDKNSIFYRPLYRLSGYDRCVDGWIRKYDLNQPPDRRIELDLEGASYLSWSSLGYPHLDQFSKTSTTPSKASFAATEATWGSEASPDGWNRGPSVEPQNAQFSTESMNSFSMAQSSANNSPGTSNATRQKASRSQKLENSRGPKPVVSLYGIQAFDVERGLWHMDNIRDLQLSSNPNDNARKIFSEPLMKITRILCSYKMEVNFPSFHGKSPLESTGFGDAFSATHSPGGGSHLGGFSFSTGNDAVLIPQVLAVLAQRI